MSQYPAALREWRRWEGDRVSGFSNHSGGRGASIPTMKAAYLIAILYFAACLLLSCASRPAGVDPAETVRLKFVAFDRHDAAAIQEIYAGAAVLHSPDYPNLAGNAQIADTYRRLFEAIPDAKDELQNLDRSADKVYAQFVLTGHWKAAPDQAVKVRIMSVYTVRGGHIVEDVTYYDRKAP
jgi:ketosteroid isomerase-like protein